MNYFFGWDNIKKGIVEWLKTFSNEDSFLSSKRMNRFIFAMSGLALTMFVIYYNRNRFSATDNLLIISPLFAYAGFELTKTEKEKQLNKDQNV